jgi:histidyl-tRNA synthetase
MNTNPARGMRDFLPEDVRRRQYVIGVIADVYQRYGFEPLETPAVENIETLMGKYGDEGDRLIFRILKRGEEGKSAVADLALRYDLTVPLARVVAQYRAQLPKYFKRYQVQPVWRADRPQKGRFREFYQCDVDAIGSTSLLIEADLLAAAAEVLARLGFDNFRIRLNHRKLLGAVLHEAGIASAHHGSALVALDKLDKTSPDAVRAEMVERGVERAAADALLARLSVGLTPDVRLDGAADLREIEHLCAGTPAAGRIQIDLSLARGLSYYTGAIFEIAVPDLAGSLGGGGRYDELIGMFLGEHVPACGISLGLERILVVMGERGMFPDSLTSTAADVMVTICNFNDGRDALELKSEAIALAATLRRGGLRVEVFPEIGDLGKQMKYAGGRGIPFATVIGAQERERGQVTVRDLATREQKMLSTEQVVEYVLSRLRAEGQQPGAGRG